MQRDFNAEWRTIVAKHKEPLPAPVLEEKPAAVVPEKSFDVVRRFLPAIPEHDKAVFYGVTQSEAKTLVHRVLKSRVVECGGKLRAMYYDYREAV